MAAPWRLRGGALQGHVTRFCRLKPLPRPRVAMSDPAEALPADEESEEKGEKKVKKEKKEKARATGCLLPLTQRLALTRAPLRARCRRRKSRRSRRR